MTSDHLDAVRALRDDPDVAYGTATIPIEAENWPADPENDWVGVGTVVRSPDDERVVLVRNWWSGQEWVVPGGGVEPSDDSLRAAARREVREETGLAVEIEGALALEAQTFVHGEESSRSFDGWLALFRGVAADTDLAENPGEHDEEIRAVRWFEEVPETVERHGDRVRAVLDSSTPL